MKQLHVGLYAILAVLSRVKEATRCQREFPHMSPCRTGSPRGRAVWLGCGRPAVSTRRCRAGS